MTSEMAILFMGYITGVVFGSATSITIYRRLIETGKLFPSYEGKPGGTQAEATQ